MAERFPRDKEQSLVAPINAALLARAESAETALAAIKATVTPAQLREMADAFDMQAYEGYAAELRSLADELERK